MQKQYAMAVRTLILPWRLYHIFNSWFDRFLPKHRYLVEEIESPAAVYLGLMKYNGVPVNADLMKVRQQEAVEQMEYIRNEIANVHWRCSDWCKLQH